MTIEEALEYWCRRLERAKGYSDEHWDAEERHAHADYVDAMTHAITALAICREHEEVKQQKSNGDRIRAMTDKELANMLSSIWLCHHFDSCEKCPLVEADNCRSDGVKRWLRSEVQNNEG